MNQEDLDVGFKAHTPLRRLFKNHVIKVAKALAAIQDNEEGVERTDEEVCILACFAFPAEEIRQEVQALKKALVLLEQLR